METKEANHRLANFLVERKQLGKFVHTVAMIPEVTVYGKSHIQTISEHTQNGGSVLFTPFPHRSHWEFPIILQRFIKTNLVTPHKHIWHKSAKYEDLLSTPANMGYATDALQQYTAMHNIETLPLALAGLFTSKEGRDIVHKARMMNRDSTQKTIEALQQGGSYIGSFIQGHRVERQGLIRAKEGLEKLLQSAPNTMVVPLVLRGFTQLQPLDDQGHGLKNLRPFFKEVIITVGQPTNYECLQHVASKYKRTDGESVHLGDAIILPYLNYLSVEDQGVDPRGDYGPDFFIPKTLPSPELVELEPGNVIKLPQSLFP